MTVIVIDTLNMYKQTTLSGIDILIPDIGAWLAPIYEILRNYQVQSPNSQRKMLGRKLIKEDKTAWTGVSFDIRWTSCSTRVVIIVVPI